MQLEPGRQSSEPSVSIPAAGRKRSLQDVVAEHIRPVTRFDANDLLGHEPEQSLAVPVELTVHQRVSYSIVQQSSPGRLPAGITAVCDQAELDAAMQDRLAIANAEAPARVKQWVDADAGAYRRLNAGEAGLLAASQGLGYQQTCGQCQGQCQQTCAACAGYGDKPCLACHGSGRTACHSCGGQRNQRCGSCDGRGRWNETISTQAWDPVRNSYVTETKTQFRTCAVCSGQGGKSCSSCGSDGKVGCATCFSHGRIVCADCRRSGRVDCPGCRASGFQHVTARVKGEVEFSENLAVASTDDQLRNLIHKYLNPAELPSLGAVLDVQTTLGGRAWHTVHQLRLDVGKVSYRIGGQALVLYGFGPESKVCCFGNIAGRLLEHDLAKLEGSIADSSRLFGRHRADLLETTGRFLRSELNMQIAERMTVEEMDGVQTAEQVEHHHRGLVDATYAVRATQALQGALGLMVGACLGLPALVLALMVGVAAGLAYARNWPIPNPWVAGGCALAGGLLIWGGLELWARWRIGRIGARQLADRVLGQIDRQGTFGRWRFGMLTGCVATAFLGLLVAHQLPAKQSEYNDRKFQQSLTDWPMQQRDFAQRSYPARDLLEQAAQQGDTRAELILAWQLLLGAGGSQVDIAGAGGWLEKSRAQMSSDPLWRAAHAVYVIHPGRGRPDMVRLSAKQLKQAADGGLDEARYWLARTQLDPRSPVHDVRGGLKTLQTAADSGHASAAFMLGKRHAEGLGVARDPDAARRYLQLADMGGVTDAKVALSRLR